MLSRVLALLLLATPASAAPLTLDEVLRAAVERAPEAAAAKAEIPVAEAEVRVARALPNPSISVGAGRSEPIFNVATQWRLPIFGQVGARVQAAERGVSQARAESESVRLRLRHDARVAYYAAERSDEELAIAVEIERLTGRVSDMARERYQVGAGTRLDQDQARLLHARATQEVADRRAEAEVARLELRRVIGLGDGAGGVSEAIDRGGAQEDALDALADPLPSVGTTPALDALLAQARDRHPDLRALVALREHAEALARSGRVDRRPSPQVELGLEVLDPSTCGNAGGAFCVGPRGALSLELPVLDRNAGPIARAEAEARAAAVKLRAASQRVQSRVRAAFLQLTAATLRAHFFDGEYVPSAQAVAGTAEEGYAVGKTGLLPLIEAERALLDARLGRTEAFFAVQQARADLEEASGVALSAP